MQKILHFAILTGVVVATVVAVIITDQAGVRP